MVLVISMEELARGLALTAASLTWVLLWFKWLCRLIGHDPKTANSMHNYLRRVRKECLDLEIAEAELQQRRLQRHLGIESTSGRRYKSVRPWRSPK